MPKTYNLTLGASKGRSAEAYLAPRPPINGRIIGLDCHPDTFTAAVLVGQTPHDARKLCCRANLSLQALLEWVAREFGPEDLFLLEASGNSFAVCKALAALNLRAAVLESAHVGKHAKTYADNDKMAAVRIAFVYLAGNAPAVWVPDDATFERRELLHAYRNAAADHTAATNSLKAYLNGHAIRLGKRSLAAESTREWILTRRDWAGLELSLLEDHFGNVAASSERRKRLYGLVAREVSADPLMLRTMKLLGIGIVNAFALLAVIGDVSRFATPQKLVAYVGLNPGRRQSGTGKDVKVGVGLRGRGDLRHLLVQGAHAVLRMGKATAMGQWGWKLFARKGNRNVAVCAVARKLLVQVWHLLKGNPPQALETNKSLTVKLTKVGMTLGKTLREQLGLGRTLDECVETLRKRILNQPA